MENWKLALAVSLLIISVVSFNAEYLFIAGITAGLIYGLWLGETWERVRVFRALQIMEKDAQEKFSADRYRRYPENWRSIFGIEED